MKSTKVKPFITILNDFLLIIEWHPAPSYSVKRYSVNVAGS